MHEDNGARQGNGGRNGGLAQSTRRTQRKTEERGSGEKRVVSHNGWKLSEARSTLVVRSTGSRRIGIRHHEGGASWTHCIASRRSWQSKIWDWSWDVCGATRLRSWPASARAWC